MNQFFYHYIIACVVPQTQQRVIWTDIHFGIPLTSNFLFS